MNASHKLSTAGAIFALSFSATLFAQQRQAQPESESPQAQEESPALRQQEAQKEQEQQYGARSQEKMRTKATELKGKQVKTQAGEELGEVEDVAVNLESGELSYLLVGAEGGEWKPVPSQAVKVEEQAGQIELTVDIDQQRWEQAPTVQQTEIAQLGQPQRGREIYQFFGEDYEARQQELQFGAPEREQQQQKQQPGQSSQQPGQSSQQPGATQQPGQSSQQQPGAAQPGEQEFGQRSSSQQQRGAQAQQQGSQQQGQTHLGSKLMDAEIQNQQQEKLGQISDFLLNIEEGRIDFVLLEAEDAEGTFAVAPQAFQVSGEQVSLNARSQHFEQAQALREQEIDQRAQQARMMGAQAKQDPQIFRYEEEAGTMFGAPGRERDEMKDEDMEKKAKEKEKEQERPY